MDAFTKPKRKDGRVRWMSQCKACRTAFERAQRLAGGRVDKDPERTKRVSDAWRKGPGLEKARMGVRRRRARLRENGGMISVWEWEQTLEAWGHRCAYCDVDARGDLTMDHVVPVSRGGEHVIENVVPACSLKHNNCNARKAARTGVEFAQASDGSGPVKAVA